MQHHGRTAVPNLYTVGLSWQRTRGSALIGWLGRDAAEIAAHAASPSAADLPAAIADNSALTAGVFVEPKER